MLQMYLLNIKIEYNPIILFDLSRLNLCDGSFSNIIYVMSINRKNKN